MYTSSIRMTSLEKISANLKLIDSKKNSFRKAVLLMTLEWKDFEEYLDSTQQSLEECFNELESREKSLDLICKSVAESNEELDSVRKSIEGRFKELEYKEEKFNLFQEEQIRNFKLREKQLDSIRDLCEERIKEDDLREEKLDAHQKSIEGLFKKLELEQKQFETIQNSIGESFKDINLKEKHLESRSKELDSIQNWIERRAKELDTKEECLEERSKELDLKERQLDSIEESTEERCKELELKEKQLNSAKELNEEHSEDLDSREKQLHSVQKFIKQSYKDFFAEKSQFKLDQRLVEERSKELELKERQIADRSKELELKEKQFADALHSRVKIEPLEYLPADNALSCNYADIRFFITMDGKSLQLFLNERSKEHDTMADEVSNALRLSLDPAKLVLDAMEGFYPPHLKKGNLEFEGSVIRRSCILLLEQLMRISPQIQPHVKEEALKIAGEWKAKMIVGNSLEVLGFLLLLASYGLVPAFDAEKIINLFEIVAQCKQSAELCRALGLTDKIPDLIQKFIRMKQHLVAIRFIFAFELVDKFPPVPLLKEYVKYSKKVANKICKNKNNSREAQLKLCLQNKAIDKRVADMRAVIRCIVDHKLESQYSPINLKNCIQWLLMQKAGNKRITSAPASKSQTQLKSERKLTLSAAAPIPTKALTTAPVLLKAPPPTLTHATAMAFILANMDGNNLQAFLNEHLEEHELMRNEISAALQMSVDSAKLVLDAIQGFHPPHLKKGEMNFEASICKRSCILLLEELLRLSPEIKSEVKEAAIELAVDWKAKIRSETENPLEILGFLQLVGTYGLASAFDADELLKLFENIVQVKHAPELCQVLGFSENIPSPQGDSKSLFSDMVRKRKEHHSMGSEALSSLRFSSDPAKLVLDALHGAYYSTLKGGKSSKLVRRSSILLLQQLMRVSLDSSPHVKAAAMNFAVDWKSKLVKTENSLDVLSFLQLLASYKLASSFNENELLGLLDIVHRRREAIDLFQLLGLVYKIPDFIQNLIKKEQRLQAIRYIYAFGLVDQFPPVPLMKDHLTYTNEVAKNISEGHDSLEAQDKATNKEVAALRDVIKCITDHRLELEFSLENLKIHIEQLERQKVDRQSAMPAPALNSQLPEQVGRKRIAPAPACVTRTQLKRQRAEKRLRKDISADAAPDAPVSTACPVRSIQPPPMHRSDMFSEQDAPYLRAPTGHYSLGGSPPVTPHMSHLRWKNGSGTPYNSGTMPFGLAGTNSAYARNFNAWSSMVARRRHFYHSCYDA
ncbi:hypothetical protein F0562_029408 [Nyssa sinensis]|uniref:FRIGIDA-like protein n=1 Tax=Nyssa sinensis TaxID=561372 RepID=A0A5J5B2Z6_9ASTE|nr:hypothetical protein F0562_029408 [Nyssa sinensis]